MEKIAEEAAEVFCALMDGMNGKAHLKILNRKFHMPLVIERIADGVKFESQTASLYSLCHYYKQNGDLMVDPEMCFIVMDNRMQQEGDHSVLIIPYMYQLASPPIYEESLVLEYGAVPAEYDPVIQHKHTRFANRWLIDIRGLGFLA